MFIRIVNEINNENFEQIQRYLERVNKTTKKCQQNEIPFFAHKSKTILSKQWEAESYLISCVGMQE